MEQVRWASRGQMLRLDTIEGTVRDGCIGISRLGGVQVAAGFSIWVQLRGSSRVEAKEGKFRLRRGDWIAFEKDSKPTVQTDRFGVCVGLTLSANALREMAQFTDCGLYADRTLFAGRGNMPWRDARTVLLLWREAATRLVGNSSEMFDTATRPILLYLAGVQRDLTARIVCCPGRSRSRKRQVFSRLQRAHLYLEGNCDRVVRISELAELTNFSSWYFSKAFQSLYEEGPQAASLRMRLEHAADLLVSTSMMIGEVAAASGFDNCCSFARAFRARFGESATGYRSASVSRRAAQAKSGALACKAIGFPYAG